MSFNKEPIKVNLQIQYDMSDTLLLPDDNNYQKRNLAVGNKKAFDGSLERSYGTSEGRIKSIDIYAIDNEGNLLDEQNNVIYAPDSSDSITLRIDNPKVFAATWRDTNETHFRPIVIY